MERDNWDRLKEEFDAIPVPPELEDRVRTALKQGKEIQPMEKKTGGHLWRNIGLSAAAVAAAFVLTVNLSPTAAQALEGVPVLGDITRVVKLRTYRDERANDNVSARIDIPKVEGAGPELEQAITDYTQQIIAQYEADAKLAEEAARAGESAHYSVDLSYTVATDNDRVFALRFDKTLVMASGTEEVKIYAVDKKTGKLLSLPDLFRPDCDCLGVLTQNIQEQMRAQIAAEEGVYWVDGAMPGEDFTQLSPDATFYIDPQRQLVIVFNEYQVAPGCMGAVEFTIPAQAVAGLALPEYLA